jgi:hypothetical protein
VIAGTAPSVEIVPFAVSATLPPLPPAMSAPAAALPEAVTTEVATVVPLIATAPPLRPGAAGPGGAAPPLAVIVPVRLTAPGAGDGDGTGVFAGEPGRRQRPRGVARDVHARDRDAAAVRRQRGVDRHVAAAARVLVGDQAQRPAPVALIVAVAATVMLLCARSSSELALPHVTGLLTAMLPALAKPLVVSTMTLLSPAPSAASSCSGSRSLRCR